ncbi:MAG: VOC family protein [Pseudomonadales bacterium]
MNPDNFGPIKQIGYLVDDLDASVNAWMVHTGLGPWLQIKNIPLTCVYKGEPSVPMIDIGLAYRGDVQIELIRQTNDAPSPYRQYFIDGRMGLHHIAHLSDNVDADIEKAEAMGLDAVCDIKMPTGGRYAYLQNAALGEAVLIELIDNNQMNQDLFKSGIEAAVNWDGAREITVIDFAEM